MPTTTSSRSRSASSARNDVLNMLKDDHRNVKKAFKAFEKLDPQDDAEECRELVERTCAELTIHAQLEEELFYPAIREVMRETDLLDEAEVEHKSAKLLMADLEGEAAADPAIYAATFKVLGEYVNHHVKEEEGEIFEQLGRAKLDWDALAESMRERRQELMAEMLPEEVADDAEESGASEDAPARRAASSRRPAHRASAASRADENDDEPS